MTPTKRHVAVSVPKTQGTMNDMNVHVVFPFYHDPVLSVQLGWTITKLIHVLIHTRLFQQSPTVNFTEPMQCNRLHLTRQTNKVSGTGMTLIAAHKMHSNTLEF